MNKGKELNSEFAKIALEIHGKTFGFEAFIFTITPGEQMSKTEIFVFGMMLKP